MPTLMTVSGLEIEIEPKQAYTLGRALECDIVVCDIVSSRRHALLSVGATLDSTFIEDLGSRNGTWVNEARIDGRTRLCDGYRIRIGATVYLVDLRDSTRSNLRAMTETGTEALEALALGRKVGPEIARVIRSDGAGPTDFAGQLGSFSLVEILQLLTQTRRSGTLHLALARGPGRIEIRAGEVHEAVFDNLTGFDALLALAHPTQGLFWLIHRADPCKDTIGQPASRLLLEICSALDEAT